MSSAVTGARDGGAAGFGLAWAGNEGMVAIGAIPRGENAVGEDDMPDDNYLPPEGEGGSAQR
jgi:hypothetical protein